MQRSTSNADIGLQTRLGSRRAFEGWYFKQVSSDLAQVWSVIVGIALERERFAFVQLIDGRSGWTRFVRYPLEQFKASSERLDVNLGPNHFSVDGLRLDVFGDDFRFTTEIDFIEPVAWKGRGLGSTIMGPFRYLPFMECRHGVFSLDHGLKGWMQLDTRAPAASDLADAPRNTDPTQSTQTLHLGSTAFPPAGRWSFNGGRGYSEKDWGLSFPSSYLWLQGNCFDKGVGSSVMTSIARIPSLGTEFTGHLGFVLHEGRQYHFATWNGSTLRDLKADQAGNAHLVLERKVHGSGLLRLEILARTAAGGLLKAPKLGVMANLIKESLDAEMDVVLSIDGRVLFEDHCRRCGMEMVGKVQDLYSKALKQK